MGGFTCSDIGQPHQIYLMWLCSRGLQQDPLRILGALRSLFVKKFQTLGSLVKTGLTTKHSTSGYRVL